MVDNSLPLALGSGLVLGGVYVLMYVATKDNMVRDTEYIGSRHRIYFLVLFALLWISLLLVVSDTSTTIVGVFLIILFLILSKLFYTPRIWGGDVYRNFYKFQKEIDEGAVVSSEGYRISTGWNIGRHAVFGNLGRLPIKKRKARILKIANALREDFHTNFAGICQIQGIDPEDILKEDTPTNNKAIFLIANYRRYQNNEPIQPYTTKDGRIIDLSIDIFTKDNIREAEKLFQSKLTNEIQNPSRYAKAKAKHTNETMRWVTKKTGKATAMFSVLDSGDIILRNLVLPSKDYVINSPEDVVITLEPEGAFHAVSAKPGSDLEDALIAFINTGLYQQLGTKGRNWLLGFPYVTIFDDVKNVTDQTILDFGNKKVRKGFIEARKAADVKLI